MEPVHTLWDALVTYFAEHKNDAKATGFLKKLTQVENVAMMFHLMDVIIPWVTHLNSIFQTEHLDVSVIKACTSTTLSEITKVKEGSGFYTKKHDEFLKQCVAKCRKWHMAAGAHEIAYSEARKAKAIKRAEMSSLTT